MKSPLSPIDIIIPVYRGFHETRRCIESVLAAPVLADFELVVIEDKSPEGELVEYLSSLSVRGLITLYKNDENLGFVSTVNRGMQLHLERDVLLLNSDTEVVNDWLDRIHAAAYSAEEIGTVTPFSNNATICSYPYNNGAGAASLPSGISLTEMDALIAKTNAGQTAEIPTAVGFCMYIKRECLNEVGYFDEKRFGRGYGEENDFSRSAAMLGWSNVLAADVYVLHVGRVSFGTEQSALQKNAMAALLDKHPDYSYTVDAFIRVNPLRFYRAAIDVACSAYQAYLVQTEMSEEGVENTASKISVSGSARLHITHSWGGGIERWVNDFTSVDTQTNFILQSKTDPNAAGAALMLWISTDGRRSKIAHWDLATPIRATDIHHPEYMAILRDLIRQLDVKTLFISSLIGHALEVFRLQLPTVVIFHDMYPFCPAFFAYCDGAPCTRCDVNSLRNCQQANSMYYFWNNTQPEWWVSFRAQYAIAMAAPWVRLVAPTQMAWSRWQRLFPAIEHLSCTIISHGVDISPTVRSDDQPVSIPHRLRVVIPGRLVEHKGLNLVAECLPELTTFADVLLLGCGGNGWAFVDMPHVEIVFDYQYAELASKIAKFNPDCALLLSIVPETFSYMLSEMQALGVPVVATSLGAYQERIQPGISGWLVEPTRNAVLQVLYRLDENRAQLQTIAKYWREHNPVSIQSMMQQYLAILPDVISSPLQGGLFDGVVRLVQQLQQDIWSLDEVNRREKQAYDEALSEAKNMQMEAERKTLQAERKALQAEFDLKAQEVRLVELQASQRQILSSRSWRLTLPLRWLGDQVRIGRNKFLRGFGCSRASVMPLPLSFHDQPKLDCIAELCVQPTIPPSFASFKRQHDVTRSEFCVLSGQPLATVWIRLDDPMSEEIYPPSLIDFIQLCHKRSNAIRFFMSSAAFERVRQSEMGGAIYRLVAERVIIRTPKEWEQASRQFTGDAAILFGMSDKPKAGEVIAMLRSGCFVIFLDVDLPEVDFHDYVQIALTSAVDLQPAVSKLFAWLAMDFDNRLERSQKIKISSFIGEA